MTTPSNDLDFDIPKEKRTWLYWPAMAVIALLRFICDHPRRQAFSLRTPEGYAIREMEICNECGKKLVKSAV